VSKSHPRGTIMAAAVVTSLSITLALAFGVPADGADRASSPGVARTLVARSTPVVTLNAIGTRYTAAPIAIGGRTSGISGWHKLELRRYTTSGGRWITIARHYVRAGSYSFPTQHWGRPDNLSYRTVLFKRGRPAAVSRVVRAHVVARSTPTPTPQPTCTGTPSPTTCPQPDAYTQERTVETPYCPHLTVTTRHQTSTVDWRWDSTSRTWVKAPTPWTTDRTTERNATADDCVHILNGVPANAAKPDLRIRDLAACTKTDQDNLNGACFAIVDPAPYNASYPSLEGKKLLKFGVTTLNVGAGPSEIIADRSAADSTDWKAYQSFYDSQGKLLGSTVDPNVQYYFAGDGHNHWHVRDFDEYSLLNSSNDEVATAEKHGYCMYDNYGPFATASGGVPSTAVYTADTSCGKGLESALTIVHGLSQGWGDTYFSYLPDQAIDITGVPDGTYTVQVHADQAGAVVESNDSNNTARVKVEIVGDTVTVVPGSSSGGV
jgi:hypothetical protein